MSKRQDNHRYILHSKEYISWLRKISWTEYLNDKIGGLLFSTVYWEKLELCKKFSKTTIVHDIVLQVLGKYETDSTFKLYSAFQKSPAPSYLLNGLSNLLKFLELKFYY